MENKKGQISIGMIFALLFVSFILFTILRANTYPGNDDICVHAYGKNYVYNSEEDFGGYCMELIMENLTKANQKEYPFNKDSLRELKDYCKTPKFFNIFNWSEGVC